MTERLYYHDPYLREFDAERRRARHAPRDGGRVVLDRTAFYPTSGGQPFDTGTLGDARVLDVVDTDDGAHSARRRSRARRDGAVHGRDRLGAALRSHAAAHRPARAVGARSIGCSARGPRAFISASTSSTIDLAREVTAAEIAARRRRSEPHRLGGPPGRRSGSPAAEEAAALPLRKEPKREGTLRLIDVEDFDLSACGGTHVVPHRRHRHHRGLGQRSGSAAARGSTFLCGGRALAGFARCATPSPAACATLSVLPAELPGRDRAAAGRRQGSTPADQGLPGEACAQEADALADAARRRVGQARRRGAARMGRGRPENDRLAHRRAPRPRGGSRVRTCSVGCGGGEVGGCVPRLRRAPPRDCRAAWRQGRRQTGDGTGRGQ